LLAEKIICCGALLWDIINGAEYIGGAPFNVAVHLRRLEADANIISKIGRDRLGVQALNTLQKLGFDLSFITVDDKYSTGTAKVTFKNGAPEYEIPVAAFDYIELTRDVKTKLEKAPTDVFVFGTMEQYRSSITEQCIYDIIEVTKPEMVFLDVNLRKKYYSREIIDSSFKVSNIIKLNESEVSVLSNLFFPDSPSEHKLIPAFSDYIFTKYGNVEIICVTQGAHGATVITPGKSEYLKADPVQIVDTVGCGDAFSAGFIYKLLKTEDPFEAGVFGNKMGGFIASKRGATGDAEEA